MAWYGPPMRRSVRSGDDLVAALLAPTEPDVAGELVLLSAPPSTDSGRIDAAVERLALVPTMVLATPDCPLSAPGVAPLADAEIAEAGEQLDIELATARSPLAAAALAVVLRGAESRPIAEGLQLESAVFAALQGGPEHRAWRADRRVRARVSSPTPRLRMERRDGVLSVTLQRPGRRNAHDRAQRDELVEALAIVAADPGLHLELRGDGASFCSGGDLDEFGTAPDPASAHLVRLERSIAVRLLRLRHRTTVWMQGPCAGSGVELAACAGRVIAHPDATFVLPELGLGLIPGAGGTVSLVRRMGRHRTAWLATTGRTIDAATARRWGLVDEIELF